MTNQPQTTPETLTDAQIAYYRQNGFVHIPGIVSKDEAAHYYEAALDLSKRRKDDGGGNIFTQLVNVWRHDDAMRPLTLHANLAAVAQRVAGVKLRLWHDHILIKQPHNKAPTEFHQDQPYWPHANSQHPISAWIALCDVPVESGCMSFIPGSFDHRDLVGQDLSDPRSLFSVCSELRWSPRVTLPLRAGDCTFHHGRCAHMATPNITDNPRVAHVVIFMDATTTYDGKRHIVTDPLGLTVGELIEGELFPMVDSS